MIPSERLPNALPNGFRTRLPNGSERASERFPGHTLYINIYPAGPLNGPRGFNVVPMPPASGEVGSAQGTVFFSLPIMGGADD